MRLLFLRRQRMQEHQVAAKTNLTFIMKKISLLLLTMCATFSLSAQLERGFIYLKNGTVVKGKYQFSEDLTKIKVLSEGSIHLYDSTDVDSINSPAAERFYSMKNNSFPGSFFFRTEFGFLFGSTSNSQPVPASFTASVNYQLLRDISAGIGAGVEFLGESYMPATVNLEYRLRPYGSTPYFFLYAGYMIPLEDSGTPYYRNYVAPNDFVIWPYPHYYDNLKPHGGLLLNPGMGYTAMFSPHFGMSVSFAYRFHRLNYSGENDYELDADYNRLNVKLGIIFN